MLSVILPTEDNHLRKLCEFELRGEEFEIIEAEDWLTGLKRAKGEFVTFLEPKFSLSDDYFHGLLDVFLDQPSFRKMAMVASASAKTYWGESKRVFGYSVTNGLVVNPALKVSNAPYAIEIGYIPGAIIRKAVLTELPVFFGDNPLHDSIYLSLKFWNNGLRCLLNPRATYYSDTEELDAPVKITSEVDGINELMVIFKREMI